MEPHPLTGVFAYPRLDLVVQSLDSCGKVHGSFVIARYLHLLFKFQPEPATWQADTARRIDIALILTHEFREKWIGFAWAVEKSRRDAAFEFLIDQHADIAIVVEDGGERPSCTGLRWNEMPHVGAACPKDFLGNIGVVRWAKQRSDIQIECRRADRQQLEIPRMTGEEYMRAVLLVPYAFEDLTALNLD